MLTPEMKKLAGIRLESKSARKLTVDAVRPGQRFFNEVAAQAAKAAAESVVAAYKAAGFDIKLDKGDIEKDARDLLSQRHGLEDSVNHALDELETYETEGY